MTCSFAPASVKLDGTNLGTITVTIATGPSHSASMSGRSQWWGTASTVALGLLLLPFFPRKRIKALLGLTASIALLIAAIACGSDSKPAPASPTTVAAGTYVVNLTASGGSGSTTKSIPLVVTVQ